MYVGRRNVEGGGRWTTTLRIRSARSSASRVLLRMHGPTTPTPRWVSRNFQDIEGNFLGTPQISTRWMSSRNPTTGRLPSAPSLAGGQSRACVPWNIYSPGGVTQDQLAYLSVPASYASNSTEYIVDGSVTGDLGKYGIKIPTAKDGISINVGAEYREEKFKFDPDYIFANGLQAGGAPSKAIDGRLHVWEGFTEVRVPHRQRPAVRQEPVGGCAATATRSTPGLQHQHLQVRRGVGADRGCPFPRRLQPRGSRSEPERAVPARNGRCRRYGRSVLGRQAGPVAGAVRRYGCDPATQYGFLDVNPAAQINTLVGGNTKLQPEIADTYTAGVVLQPKMVPNLVASVDVFYIKIRDTITSLSSNTVITDCALTGESVAVRPDSSRSGRRPVVQSPSNFVTATYVEHRQGVDAGPGLVRRTTTTDLGGFGQVEHQPLRHVHEGLLHSSRYRDWAPTTAPATGARPAEHRYRTGATC